MCWRCLWMAVKARVGGTCVRALQVHAHIDGRAHTRMQRQIQAQFCYTTIYAQQQKMHNNKTVSVLLIFVWCWQCRYEGAGIYRHVQLIATSKVHHHSSVRAALPNNKCTHCVHAPRLTSRQVHVETDGVFARPSVTGPIASGASPPDGHRAAAQVQVAATVANDDTAAHQLTVWAT